MNDINYFYSFTIYDDLVLASKADFLKMHLNQKTFFFVRLYESLLTKNFRKCS